MSAQTIYKAEQRRIRMLRAARMAFKTAAGGK